MVEGYSHELSSCGFWPGGGEEGAFYAYAYPEPDGFSDRAGARRTRRTTTTRSASSCCRTRRCAAAADPDRTLLDFLQSTYVAAADLGAWDRAALEAAPPSAGPRAEPGP